MGLVSRPVPCALIAWILLTASAAAGAGIRAHATDAPLRLDGRLDEPAWRDAPVAGDFLQFEPDRGRPAVAGTRFHSSSRWRGQQ